MPGKGRTRRRFLTVAGSTFSVGIAGCSDSESAEQSTPTGTESPMATGANSPTSTEEESPTGTEDEGPGYKANHWHGRLFFELDGELVDFDQPKYFLKNLEDENPDTVYFHFHEGVENHGPNEWSNEKKIVTFQRALNLLPGISYDRQNGNHVVEYEGTTYDATRSGMDVSVHRGTETIDPTTYEVRHDDNFWVRATSEDAQRTASPSHGDADVGTLILDINNHRADFSRAKYVDGGSDTFHFHDDGNPNMWYKEGRVTLQEALNGLPDISYEQSDGNHVLSYENGDYPDHSRQFDGGASPHEILIRERTTDIDPTTYEPKAGDIIWIYVHSSVVTDNEH